MDQAPIVSKRRDKESLKVKIRDYYQKLERLNSHFPRTGPRYSFSMSVDSNKSQSQIRKGKIYIEGPAWNDDGLSDIDETVVINKGNDSEFAPEIFPSKQMKQSLSDSEFAPEIFPSKQTEQSLSLDRSPILPGIADNSRYMKEASSDIAVIQSLLRNRILA
jgi:hypothetical protein